MSSVASLVAPASISLVGGMMMPSWKMSEVSGLIEPARSPSGYRRFDAADVERLRYILTAQRDEYLPLRVIKDRLAAAEDDAGEDHDGPPHRRRPLSRRELLDAAGIDEGYLTELEDFGLVRPSGRQYGPEALDAARIIVALGRYGVQARHLRAVRAAVEREHPEDHQSDGRAVALLGSCTHCVLPFSRSQPALIPA